MDDIMVSVWCTTYNHEKYIKQALDGFVSQVADFRYEVIMYDDASTDDTQKIIMDYYEEYPDIIVPFFRKENGFERDLQNFKERQQELLKLSRGKYIATCEGDDFWIDSQKLQIQVDFLEKHPECMLVGHNNLIFNEKTGELSTANPIYKDGFVEMEDLILHKNGFIHTATHVYRREIYNMSDFFYRAGVGDYPRLLYSALIGKVYYTSRIMSVYRYLREGSMTTEGQKDVDKYILWCLRLVNFTKKFDEYTNYKYTLALFQTSKAAVESVFWRAKECNCQDIKELLIKKNKETKGEYFTVVQWLLGKFRYRTDLNYIHNKTRIFCEQSTRLFLWGTGNNGRLISSQLTNNYIDFEGFVVSDPYYSEDECLGKKVVCCSDLLKDREGVKILVCMEPRFMEEIKSWLDTYFKDSYFYPLDIDWCFWDT